MAISIDKYSAKTARNGYLWRVRFTYKDAYGKEHPHTKRGFKTKKEAEAYGVKKFKELQNTHLTSLKASTLSSMWDLYVELEGSKKAARTIRAYDYIYHSHVEPVFGDTPIQNITYIMLKRYFNDRQHLSHKTLKNIKAVIAHCFETALNSGLIQYDITRSVKVGGRASGKKQDAYLSFNELYDLEDKVKCSKRLDEFQIQNRLMILRLGYYLGLRAGEIHGLMFEDIDWDAHTVTIKRQLLSLTGGCVLSDQLKTPSSYATLPICDVLYGYLVEWRKMNPFDMVITTNQGDVMPRRTIENYFRNLAPGFYLHQLRHSFCTNLHLAGVDQVTASSLSRHGSVEVLNNIYIHPQETSKKDAISRAFDSQNRNAENAKN